MNQHGSGAFPSYNTIAQAASLGRSTVIKHIDIASEKGWILKTVRPKGNQDNETNLYGISFPLPSPAGGLGVVHQEYHLVHTVDHPSPFGGPPLVHVVDPNTPVLTPQRTPQKHSELPGWLPQESWQGFVEMRQKIRKPMTPRAVSMILKKLEGFMQSGQDVAAILDQSVVKSWQDVFPVRQQYQAQQRMGKQEKAQAFMDVLTGRSDSYDANDPFTIDAPATRVA